MKTRVRLGMTPKQFVSRFWQKKPLFLKQGYAGFEDPITPDELAGLACEDGVESRIVDSRTWKVTFGPHKERAFRKLPPTHWTLLVQEVQRWVPEAAALLDAFSFLPSHRLDDVMVSYAPKGGTVGPHDDSYDVFLVQGQGRRSWKLDTRGDRDRTIRPGLDLKILKRFETSEQFICEKGDVLYIPPGVGHYGVALDDCLTYSIGFRAPNRGELWRELVEDALVRPDACDLYRDPDLTLKAHSGEIDRASLVRVRAMVRGLDLSDDALDRFYARFATRLKPGHELEAPERVLTPVNICRRWLRGDALVRSEECRFAFLRRSNELLFYYGGRELVVSKALAPVIELVTERRDFSAESLAATVAKKRETLALL
ncbi:MAG: cupin domain-containing protein, partial [Polyangiaceae bacterium]